MTDSTAAFDIANVLFCPLTANFLHWHYFGIGSSAVQFVRYCYVMIYLLSIYVSFDVFFFPPNATTCSDELSWSLLLAVAEV